MKKFKLLLILFAGILLTGCYKYEAKMEITKDKKLNFEVIYATMITNNDDDETNKAINCSDLNTKLGDAWTYEKYKDEKYEGCKLKKQYANIDDISTENDITVELSKIGDGVFEDKWLFKKVDDTYYASYKFSVGEQSEESKSDLENMKNMFDLKYIVKLPEKSLSNNATTIEDDGKTLIWELDVSKDTDINYSFTLSEVIDTKTSDIPWLYIGIAAGVVVIIVVVFIVCKGKKCDCSNCKCEENKKIDNKDNN